MAFAAPSFAHAARVGMGRGSVRKNVHNLSDALCQLSETLLSTPPSLSQHTIPIVAAAIKAVAEAMRYNTASSIHSRLPWPPSSLDPSLSVSHPTPSLSRHSPLSPTSFSIRVLTALLPCRFPVPTSKLGISSLASSSASRVPPSPSLSQLKTPAAAAPCTSFSLSYPLGTIRMTDIAPSSNSSHVVSNPPSVLPSPSPRPRPATSKQHIPSPATKSVLFPRSRVRDRSPSPFSSPSLSVSSFPGLDGAFKHSTPSSSARNVRPRPTIAALPTTHSQSSVQEEKKDKGTDETESDPNEFLFGSSNQEQEEFLRMVDVMTVEELWKAFKLRPHMNRLSQSIFDALALPRAIIHNGIVTGFR